MSLVHYDPSDLSFKAWVAGVLTPLIIGGGGGGVIPVNNGLNQPLAIDGLDADDNFPFPFIQKPPEEDFVLVAKETSIPTYLGKAPSVGYSGLWFGSAVRSYSNYALLWDSGGSLSINVVSGGTLSLRSGNGTIVDFTSAGAFFTPGSLLTGIGALTVGSLTTTGSGAVNTKYLKNSTNNAILELDASGTQSWQMLSQTAAKVLWTFKGHATQSSNLTEWLNDAGTVLASVSPTGLLTLNSGQIKFPGTQNASADVNTLDDYEEGTWTPTITGQTSSSGQVYNVQGGRYIKVGKVVHVQAEVRLSTLGTITGSVCIGGLPFTSVSGSDFRPNINLSGWEGLTTAIVFMNGVVLSNSTLIRMAIATAAATTLNVFNQANLANGSGFAIGGTYIADN